MGDRDLRELERRFRETGSLEDEQAWFGERLRTGEHAGVLSALESEIGQNNLGEPAGIFRGWCLEGGETEDSMTRIERALAAGGFTLSGELQPMDRHAAQRLIAWRSHRTSAYEVELRSPEDAARFARRFLDLLPSCARYFSNLMPGWSESGFVSTCHITGHTFEDGVLADAGSFVAMAWFMDED
ncbi:MAG: hypothetical protein R3F62_30270 [Planctomycetota bacterium]